jgi:hypothetical protein
VSVRQIEVRCPGCVCRKRHSSTDVSALKHATPRHATPRHATPRHDTTTHAQTHKRTNAQTHKRTNAQTHKRTNAQTHKRAHQVELQLVKGLIASLAMRLGHLQVDNQLPFTPFPALLYPLPDLHDSHASAQRPSSDLEEGRQSESQAGISRPCLTLEVEQDLSYTEILYIRRMNLCLRPLDVNVDGMLAAALLGMATR